MSCSVVFAACQTTHTQHATRALNNEPVVSQMLHGAAADRASPIATLSAAVAATAWWHSAAVWGN